MSSYSRCKKLIEEEESKRHIPTISHYRDNKNPMNTIKNPNYLIIVTPKNSQSKQATNRFTTSAYSVSAAKEIDKQAIINAGLKVKDYTIKVMKQNPESALMSLLDKIYDAETRLNSAVYIPYLTKAEQALIKSNLKYFTLKDGRKSVMLSKQGVSKLGYTQPLGKKNPVDASKLKSLLTKPSTSSTDNARFKRYIENLRYEIKEAKAELAELNRSIRKSQGITYDDAETQGFLEGRIEDLTNELNQQLGKKITAKKPITTKRKIQIIRGKNPVRQNYDETAIFETHIDETLDNHSAMFQGGITGKTIKAVGSDFTNKHTARLGQLALIIIETPNKDIIEVKPSGKDAWLSIDLRKNLQLSGKDVKFPNAKLDGDEMRLLGKIKQIDYITKKQHIEKGETVRYFHELGEVTKEYPTLWIDSDGMPVIVGGNYDVWKSGIVN